MPCTGCSLHCLFLCHVCQEVLMCNALVNLVQRCLYMIINFEKQEQPDHNVSKPSCSACWLLNHVLALMLDVVPRAALG